jgi:uncharacterized protein
MGREYSDLFQGKSIIGMVHLSGMGTMKIDRALEELDIYERCGVAGAIIENYCKDATAKDVEDVLKRIEDTKRGVVIGVNVLGNTPLGFKIADNYGAKFVQVDNVHEDGLDLHRLAYPKLVVLGGVGFKYVPDTGNPLEEDIEQGMRRCDAIVTTGSDTGVETPIEKLAKFRMMMGDFPFIVGAGVNAENVTEQLTYTNGAIVGSSFKPDKNTEVEVNENLVRKLMEII